MCDFHFLSEKEWRRFLNSKQGHQHPPRFGTLLSTYPGHMRAHALPLWGLPLHLETSLSLLLVYSGNPGTSSRFRPASAFSPDSFSWQPLLGHSKKTWCHRFLLVSDTTQTQAAKVEGKLQPSNKVSSHTWLSEKQIERASKIRSNFKVSILNLSNFCQLEAAEHTPWPSHGVLCTSLSLLSINLWRQALYQTRV